MCVGGWGGGRHLRWIPQRHAVQALNSLKAIRILGVCARFMHFMHFSFFKTPGETHTRHPHILSRHVRKRTRTIFIYFLGGLESFFMSCIASWRTRVAFELQTSSLKNCKRAHHSSRITRARVSYRGGGFLQGSLCCPVAKQPSQRWCSCGEGYAQRLF